MIVSQSVDSDFFNILKLRVFIEEKEDRTIDSIEIAAHKHLSHCDSVEFLSSMPIQSHLSNRSELFGVQEVQESCDHEYIWTKDYIFKDLSPCTIVKLSFHCHSQISN